MNTYVTNTQPNWKNILISILIAVALSAVVSFFISNQTVIQGSEQDTIAPITHLHTISLENGELIENEDNGVISMTATTVAIVGAQSVSGAQTIGGAHTVTGAQVVSGTQTIVGAQSTSGDVSVALTFNVSATTYALVGDQTLTPTVSFYEFNPATALTVTLIASECTNGDYLEFSNVANVDVVIVDSSIRTTDGNLITMNQYDTSAWKCTSTAEWYLLWNSGNQ